MQSIKRFDFNRLAIALCDLIIFRSKIFKIWTQLFDGNGPSLISPNSTIKSTQIVECAVGDGTVIAEKTSLKNSVLGRNCQIIEKVRISDSVLMNGVTVEERFVYRDRMPTNFIHNSIF